MLKQILSVLLTISIVATLVGFKKVDEKRISRKIIIFNATVAQENKKEDIISSHGAKKLKHLSIVNGMVIEATEDQQSEILQDKNVLRIEDDLMVSADQKPNHTVTPRPTVTPTTKTTTPTVTPVTTQQISWGMDKIDAEMAWPSLTNSTVKVAIIDSGIDITHPDLKNNYKGGINTINAGATANDDYGHGTHVAGIIAASNNNIGTVGVAPNIGIYVVKALDSQGNGYISDIVEGIDWAIQNKMDAINMSFGITSNSETLKDAIIRANKAGIVQVAASGNDGCNTLYYPSCYPEVISVGAIDETSKIASFSSYGKVDFVAPGVNIFSTYKAGTYQYLSGTSMAAPHITGAAALLKGNLPKTDLNHDGIVTPAEVKQRLALTASDLGNVGVDNVFGAGLINVYQAINK